MEEKGEQREKELESVSGERIRQARNCSRIIRSREVKTQEGKAPNVADYYRARQGRNGQIREHQVGLDHVCRVETPRSVITQREIKT